MLLVSWVEYSGVEVRKSCREQEWKRNQGLEAVKMEITLRRAPAGQTEIWEVSTGDVL